VLKQTSPLAVRGAPKDWPRQTLPSSRARMAELMAFQYRGFDAKLKSLYAKKSSHPERAGLVVAQSKDL
jgi:hypothetical protein